MFLMMVVLGAGVLVICSAQPATNGMESGKSQPDPDQPQAGAESKNSPLFANDPDFFRESDFNPGGAGFSI